MENQRWRKYSYAQPFVRESLDVHNGSVTGASAYRGAGSSAVSAQGSPLTLHVGANTVVPSSPFAAQPQEHIDGPVGYSYNSVSSSAIGVKVKPSSDNIVRSYGDAAGTAGNVSYRMGNSAPAVVTVIPASFDALLATNTLTTSAALVRGGITTYDSDAATSPAMRRGSTPGNPGQEDELPIDGKSGGAALFLSFLAVGYGVVRKPKAESI